MSSDKIEHSLDEEKEQVPEGETSLTTTPGQPPPQLEQRAVSATSSVESPIDSSNTTDTPDIGDDEKVEEEVVRRSDISDTVGDDSVKKTKPKRRVSWSEEIDTMNLPNIEELSPPDREEDFTLETEATPTSMPPIVLLPQMEQIAFSDSLSAEPTIDSPPKVESPDIGDDETVQTENIRSSDTPDTIVSKPIQKTKMRRIASWSGEITSTENIRSSDTFNIVDDKSVQRTKAKRRVSWSAEIHTMYVPSREAIPPSEDVSTVETASTPTLTPSVLPLPQLEQTPPEFADAPDIGDVVQTRNIRSSDAPDIADNNTSDTSDIADDSTVQTENIKIDAQKTKTVPEESKIVIAYVPEKTSSLNREGSSQQTAKVQPDAENIAEFEPIQRFLRKKIVERSIEQYDIVPVSNARSEEIIPVLADKSAAFEEGSKDNSTKELSQHRDTSYPSIAGAQPSTEAMKEAEGTERRIAKYDIGAAYEKMRKEEITRKEAKHQDEISSRKVVDNSSGSIDFAATESQKAEENIQTQHLPPHRPFTFSKKKFPSSRCIDEYYAFTAGSVLREREKQWRYSANTLIEDRYEVKSSLAKKEKLYMRSVYFAFALFIFPVLLQVGLTPMSLLKLLVNQHEEDPLDRYNDNLAELTSPNNPESDIPFFWDVPGVAGTMVPQILGQCFSLVQASHLWSKGFHIEPLQVEMLNGTNIRYLNIDTDSYSDIHRAISLGLVDSNLVDVIISPQLQHIPTLFTAKRQGRMFSLLSHPVERAVAEYRILAERNKEISLMTVEEYAQSRFVVNNWLTRNLVGEMGELTPHHIELAKETLRRKCFVGLMNQTSESIEKFINYFQWKNKNDNSESCTKGIIDNVQKTYQDYPRVGEGSETWNLLLSHNVHDMEVYKYAENLFMEQTLNLVNVNRLRKRK